MLLRGGTEAGSVTLHDWTPAQGTQLVREGLAGSKRAVLALAGPAGPGSVVIRRRTEEELPEAPGPACMRHLPRSDPLERVH